MPLAGELGEAVWRVFGDGVEDKSGLENLKREAIFIDWDCWVRGKLGEGSFGGRMLDEGEDRTEISINRCQPTNIENHSRRVNPSWPSTCLLLSGLLPGLASNPLRPELDSIDVREGDSKERTLKCSGSLDEQRERRDNFSRLPTVERSFLL